MKFFIDTANLEEIQAAIQFSLWRIDDEIRAIGGSPLDQR